MMRLALHPLVLACLVAAAVPSVAYADASEDQAIARSLAGDGLDALKKNDFKTAEESCRMISRDFLRSVKCTPDYVVIVHEPEMGSLSCSHTMDGILTEAAKNPSIDNIRKLAEGDGASHNILGRHLASISQDLVAKGYFAS